MILRALGAAAALVVIGWVEALVSLRQLEAVGGRPRLGPDGLLLAAAGFAASVAVYVALGWRARDDAEATRTGAGTGALAGLIGGTLRALLVRDALTEAVARYATVPDWFVPLALGVFVTLSAIASVAGGAVLAWSGRRLRLRRPPRRPA